MCLYIRNNFFKVEISGKRVKNVASRIYWTDIILNITLICIVWIKDNHRLEVRQEIRANAVYGQI